MLVLSFAGTTFVPGLRDTIGTDGQTLIVTGYRAVGDGGGGSFYWDSACALADDGGTVITPTGAGATGRWRRLFDRLTVRHFGAAGDGVTDDTAAIQAALDVGGAIHFPRGLYKVVAPSATVPALAVRKTRAQVTADGAELTKVLVCGSADGQGCGLLIENIGGTGPDANNAHKSSVSGLAFEGSSPMPADLVVVHAVEVCLSDIMVTYARRFGVLIESGNVGAGILGATLRASGDYLLADFWRLDRCEGVFLGNWQGGDGVAETNGAAFYVHGSDSNGGVAHSVEATDTNATIADFSLGGCTWIACYSQDGKIGYSTGPNYATFIGCGSEDYKACNFASSAVTVVGGSLASFGSTYGGSRLGVHSAVHCRTIREDTTADPVDFNSGSYGSNDQWGSWWASNGGGAADTVTFRRTSDGVTAPQSPPLAGELDNGWWGLRTGQISDLTGLLNYPILISDPRTSVGEGWAMFPRGFLLGEPFYKGRVKMTTGAQPALTDAGNPGDIIWHHPVSAGGFVGSVYVDGVGWKPFGAIST